MRAVTTLLNYGEQRKNLPPHPPLPPPFFLRKSPGGCLILIGGLFHLRGCNQGSGSLGFGDTSITQATPWRRVSLACYFALLEILAAHRLDQVVVRGGVFYLTVLMSVFIVATIVAKCAASTSLCAYASGPPPISLYLASRVDSCCWAACSFLWRTPLPHEAQRPEAARSAVALFRAATGTITTSSGDLSGDRQLR